MPAALDYRKPRGDAEAEVRLQATLDDAARAAARLRPGRAVSGPVPIKLGGPAAAGRQDSRFAIEADLTPARIDNLLPGWIKPPGAPAHAPPSR